LTTPWTTIATVLLGALVVGLLAAALPPARRASTPSPPSPRADHPPGGCRMDQIVFDRINALARATPWLHQVVLSYATYGPLIFALLLVAGWWRARRHGEARQMAAMICAGAATVAAVGINQPIVNAVHRPRPYTDHVNLVVLATRSADFSFPSDHAVMAGAAATGLIFVARGLAAWAMAAALVMAFARVYIAAHYPFDVVVGLLLGAVVALAVYGAGHRMLTRAVTVAENRGRLLRPLLTARPVDAGAGAR
jgi:membrane-associated phospholipid phosphatase